jgi:hypothetical protein
MLLNRTFFALLFVSATLVFTAIWGQQGLTIDPDGRPAAATNAVQPQDTPSFDSGLTIDPDGR